MNFNRTYLLFLTLVVLIPTLITGILFKSTGWTLMVFLITNILARRIQPVFHFLFRLMGDHSENSRLNTTIRLILTQTDFERSVSRIYPDKDVKNILEPGLEVIDRMITMAEEVDNQQILEEEAKKQLLSLFPALDQGNINWLNSAGRRFLKRRARSLAQSGYL